MKIFLSNEGIDTKRFYAIVIEVLISVYTNNMDANGDSLDRINTIPRVQRKYNFPHSANDIVQERKEL